MKIIQSLFFAALILFAPNLIGQESIPPAPPAAEQEVLRPTKYCGFNANPFLSQLVPFNQKKAVITNASLMIRGYSKKNFGFRCGFGIGVDEASNFENLFMSFDLDFRRKLSKRWLFFQGFGGALKLVADNNLNNRGDITIATESFFGTAYHVGAEYKVNNVFSLSTEANLKFGFNLGNNNGGFLADGLVGFRIEPPITLMAHFNITKK